MRSTEARIHAAVIYQRAKLLRLAVVVLAASVLITQLVSSDFSRWLKQLSLDAPAVVGLSLFVSFFTFTLESSTRRRCQESLAKYVGYLERTGRLD